MAEQEEVVSQQESSQAAQVQDSEFDEREDTKPLQREIQELLMCCEELEKISVVCESALEQTATLKDQDACQKELDKYAHSLKGLPQAIQYLHDFSRHTQNISSFADETLQLLVSARGGESGRASSEEIRIVESAQAAGSAVDLSIFELEQVLSGVRQHTKPLIELIAYEGDHFFEHASEAMRDVRIDLVSSHVHKEHFRLEALAGQLALLGELRLHGEELSGASQ